MTARTLIENTVPDDALAAWCATHGFHLAGSDGETAVIADHDEDDADLVARRIVDLPGGWELDPRIPNNPELQEPDGVQAQLRRTVTEGSCDHSWSAGSLAGAPRGVLRCRHCGATRQPGPGKTAAQTLSDLRAKQARTHTTHGPVYRDDHSAPRQLGNGLHGNLRYR